MRYDLAFFLCCCKSFLGDNETETETETSSTSSSDFYKLLGVERDVTPEQIKRAYKRQSLQMHPDKLAQRGKTVTKEDQARFTRMKEAYECLSDPHKRETYNAIGERGMKWIDEPFSMDPQELAQNFTKSSVLDRSKIFAIFVAIAVAVLVLPVVVCLHVDGVFGNDASWMATLIPLWLSNAFVLFYHSRVIMMPNIQRPDHVPPERWVDPLPMNRRIFSLVRFLLVMLFELLVALKLDNLVEFKWAFVFIPLYVWEATTMYKKWPLARLIIVTVEDLETALGKPFADFTAEETELIGKRYSVVPSTTSPEFQAAQKIKARARQDMMKSVFRLLFIIVLVIQIDTPSIDLNWWLVFAPFWIMTFWICVANYQAFAEVQIMATEKDPSLFGLSNDENNHDEEMGTGTTSTENVAVGTTNTTIGSGSGSSSSSNTNYGSVGVDDAATPEATSAAVPQSKLTEEEKEQLKEQVMNSGSTLCTKCCSQGFLLILILLIVGKLQGASFSSLWIISPFLFAAGIILCCLGCAIFGVSEVPDDNGVEFDSGDFVDLVDDSAGNLNSNNNTPISPSPIHNNNNAQQPSVPIEPINDTGIGGQMTTGITASMEEGSNQSKSDMEIRELD